MAPEKLATGLRREQIALAAISIIAEQGLAGLSMAALAERVGLVPSAIYRHFENKDAVVNAALDLIESRLIENVRSVSEETADPLERLHRLVLRHAQLVRETMAFPRLIFAEHLSAGHPDRKARVQRIFRGYLDRIGEIVRRGQNEGVLRRDVSPATAALLLVGIVQPAGVLWYLSDGRFAIDRHVREAWRAYADAMRAH